MILFNKIPMNFEGKEYEIRLLYDDTTINVVAFHNNHPANGFRHQVKLPKKCDPKGVLEKDAVKELVEISRNDIIDRRWDSISKIIAENSTNPG